MVSRSPKQKKQPSHDFGLGCILTVCPFVFRRYFMAIDRLTGGLTGSSRLIHFGRQFQHRDAIMSQRHFAQFFNQGKACSRGGHVFFP